MTPWLAPKPVEPLEGERLRAHYQLELRRIRKWLLLAELEGDIYNSFWNKLREVERPLYRLNSLVDEESISEVLVGAENLGYRSSNYGEKRK